MLGDVAIETLGASRSPQDCVQTGERWGKSGENSFQSVFHPLKTSQNKQARWRKKPPSLREAHPASMHGESGLAKNNPAQDDTSCYIPANVESGVVHGSYEARFCHEEHTKLYIHDSCTDRSIDTSYYDTQVLRPKTYNTAHFNMQSRMPHRLDKKG